MFAYKIEVNEEMSNLVQLKAFEMGYHWEFDQLMLNNTDKPSHLRSNYLYLNKNGTIYFSDNQKYFRTERNYIHITPQEFLNL